MLLSRALRAFADGRVAILLDTLNPSAGDVSVFLPLEHSQLAGAAEGDAWLAAPLLICGGLKIVYDLAIWWAFRHWEAAAPSQVSDGPVSTAGPTKPMLR